MSLSAKIIKALQAYSDNRTDKLTTAFTLIFAIVPAFTSPPPPPQPTCGTERLNI